MGGEGLTREGCKMDRLLLVLFEAMQDKSCRPSSSCSWDNESLLGCRLRRSGSWLKVVWRCLAKREEKVKMWECWYKGDEGRKFLTACGPGSALLSLAIIPYWVISVGACLLACWAKGLRIFIVCEAASPQCFFLREVQGVGKMDRPFAWWLTVLSPN